MAKEKEGEKLTSALQRLEKIVEDLGTKEIDVDTGIEKFREGVEIIKYCRGRLQKAENEFNELKKELDTEDEFEKEGE